MSAMFDEQSERSMKEQRDWYANRWVEALDRAERLREENALLRRSLSVLAAGSPDVLEEATK